MSTGTVRLGLGNSLAKSATDLASATGEERKKTEAGNKKWRKSNCLFTLSSVCNRKKLEQGCLRCGRSYKSEVIGVRGVRYS